MLLTYSESFLALLDQHLIVWKTRNGNVFDMVIFTNAEQNLVLYVSSLRHVSALFLSVSLLLNLKYTSHT